MTEEVNYRKERIERLLRELKYEVEVGMIQREIEENMSFRFIVPISRTYPDGVVFCQFSTRATSHYNVGGEDPVPRLKVVEP